MEWAEARGNWAALQQSIMTRWPKLDATEVAAADGDRSAFSAHLANVYGLSGKDAEVEIDEWLQGPLPTDSAMDETKDNAQIRESAKHIPEGEDVYAEDADFGDDRLSESPVGRTD